MVLSFEITKDKFHLSRCHAALLFCALNGSSFNFASSPAISQETAPGNLPSGWYAYFGADGKSPPRKLKLFQDGTMQWQDDFTFSSPKVRNWEKNEYPFVEWKPRPVANYPGMYVQLSTTYDQNFKYKCILFKDSTSTAKASTEPGLKVNLVPSKQSDLKPVSVMIVFLDNRAFKIREFLIPSSAFVPITGTRLLEAKGEVFQFDQREYSNSYDYAVRTLSDQSPYQ